MKELNDEEIQKLLETRLDNDLHRDLAGNKDM